MIAGGGVVLTFCRFLGGDTFRLAAGALIFGLACCCCCSCGFLGAGVVRNAPGSTFCGVVRMALKDIVFGVLSVSHKLANVMVSAMNAVGGVRAPVQVTNSLSRVGKGSFE